jgi:hypothetical protein
MIGGEGVYKLLRRERNVLRMYTSLTPLKNSWKVELVVILRTVSRHLISST